MNQIVSVQVLRAIAALSVAYGHAAYDAMAIAARAGRTAEPPLRDLSAAGVDLFFVISGFVMVWSSRGLFGAPGAAAIFIKRRLARIVPLYWTTTTLFLVAVALMPQALNSATPTVGEIAKSYLFIPFQRGGDGQLQPIYGLGWTLNYEMFFYLCFAILLGLTARKAVATLTAAFIAIVAAGYAFAPQTAPLLFWSQPIILEFVLGALVGVAYLAGWRVSRAIGLAVIVAAFLWLLAATRGAFPQGAFERVLALGAPAALLLAGLVLAERAETSGSSQSWLALLGDASYALYLIHPMAIRSLHVVWNRFDIGDLWHGWAFVLAALCASTVASIAVYRLFELPVTRWLRGAKTAT